jgi:hypothetical protein
MRRAFKSVISQSIPLSPPQNEMKEGGMEMTFIVIRATEETIP